MSILPGNPHGFRVTWFGNVTFPLLLASSCISSSVLSDVAFGCACARLGQVAFFLTPSPSWVCDLWAFCVGGFGDRCGGGLS